MAESDFGIPDSLKIAIPLAIGFSYGASCLAYRYGASGNIGEYLSALIRAESGIIAITFSVLFLGVQIASSKYTSRLSKSYFSDRLVQSTVLLLAVATGLDLLLLYNLPDPVGRRYVSFVFVSSALSIVAFYSLYLSINRIFVRTTPEGIIRTSSARLSPLAMVRYAEDPEDQEHPTRDLFDLIGASIEEGARMDSKSGFETYIDDLADIAEDHQTKNSCFSKSQYKLMYNTIFVNQLPELFIRSTVQDLRGIRTPVAMCQRQLAQVVYDVYPDITAECMQGFISMLEELDSAEEMSSAVESSIQIVGEQMMGFIYYLVSHHDQDRLPAILNQLTEFLYHQPELVRPLSPVLLRYLPSLEYKIQVEMMSTRELYLDEITLPNKNINAPMPNKDYQSNENSAIISCYQLHILLSRIICQKGGPTPELGESWEDSFRLSSRTPHPAFQEDIIETILELSQISEEVPQSETPWIETVAQCRMINNRVVSQTIGEWLEEIENKRTTGFYRSISDTAEPFSITDYPTSRSYGEIKQSVREIQTTSLREYRTLRWGTEEIEEFRDTIFDNLDDLFDESLVFVRGDRRYFHPKFDSVFSSASNLVGPDSIFAYTSQKEPVFVKVVRSLGESDFEMMMELAKDIYDEIPYDEYSELGPHRYQFVIVAPDITDNVKSKFNHGPLRAVSIDSDTFPHLNIKMQTNLSDFTHTPPFVRTSDLVSDSLEIQVESDY